MTQEVGVTHAAGDVAALRAAFQATGDRAPDPESCPRPETILRAVRGELPPAELRSVVDHTTVCAACAEDWRLAVAYQRELDEAVPARAPAHGSVIWRRWAAAAAAGLALFAVGLGWSGWFGTTDPAYRNGRRQAIRSLVPEGAALPREAFVLRWTAVPGAAAYEVEVTTEALAPIASAKRLPAPELQVPPTSLAGLPPGTRLYWQATALLADGSRLPSATFSARLR